MILPLEIVFSGFSVLALVFSSFFKTKCSKYNVNFFSNIAITLVFYGLILFAKRNNILNINLANLNLEITHSIFFKEIIYPISLIAIYIIHKNFQQTNLFKYEIFTLISLVVSSASYMCSGISNLASLYILLEIQSLGCGVIIASSSAQKVASEAAIKYIIVSTLASLLFLCGVVIIYLTHRSFDIFLLSYLNNIQMLGVLLIITSLLIKIGIFPVHSWFIDVCSGVEVSILNFINTIPKISLIFAICYINKVTNFVQFHSYFFINLFAIGALFGTIRGIIQKDVKRIIGYSGIVNAGIMLTFVFAANANPEIFKNLQSYLLGYSIASCAFSLSSTLMLKDRFCFDIVQSVKGSNFYSISNLISLLSLLGIPPSLGFFIKFIAIKDILYFQSISDSCFIMLMIIISILISSYYYLKIVKMIFSNIDREAKTINSENTSKIILILMCSFLLFGFAIL